MSTTNDTTGGLAGPSDNPGTTPGAMGGDKQPGVDPAAIKRGHEADGYHAASVLSVPLMVVGFFLTAFAVTSGVFYFVTKPETDPSAHPGAAARNAPPLNDRLNRTYRGGEIDQPRLEPLVLRDEGGQTFSRQPLKQGNSPQIHPEALRVSKENTPALFATGWVDQGKKVARIPLSDAMDIALKGGVLKAAKNETKAATSEHTPSAANAGREAREHKQ